MVVDILTGEIIGERFAKMFFEDIGKLLSLTKVEIDILILMMKDIGFNAENSIDMTPKRKKAYAKIIGLKSYRSITNSLSRMVDKGVLKDLRTDDRPYKFQINPYIFFKGNDYQRAKVIISYEDGKREVRAFNDVQKMREYLEKLESNNKD